MVKAVRVHDIAELRGSTRTAGAYDVRVVDGAIRGITFICPCGCGREGYLPARGCGHSHEWDISGDIDCLTANPSVQFVGGCLWHGWLKSGEWVAV
ncbi:hypothetical protein D2T29_19685 [Sinirhodobacter populi]|uniref:Uncharacterized protein n=1 Tax=Paenirhodobacter populi TaxID=2306993 RepID=A0A443K211_9RHOB|nr:DUF6527 family protein [Sinirhodobacter populi]RWR26801.1 hypothetical protein D2T29_19685 [Sinirhodobacter populi]